MARNFVRHNAIAATGRLVGPVTGGVWASDVWIVVTVGDSGHIIFVKRGLHEVT